MRTTGFAKTTGDLFEESGNRRLPEIEGLSEEQRSRVLAELAENEDDDVTFAVLLTFVPSGSDGDVCTTSVNVANVPDASDAMLQLTVAPVEQLNAGPLFSVSDENVVPAGSTSDHETFIAVDGPLLPTLMR